jgi:hypothetical protein
LLAVFALDIPLLLCFSVARYAGNPGERIGILLQHLNAWRMGRSARC